MKRTSIPTLEYAKISTNAVVLMFVAVFLSACGVGSTSSRGVYLAHSSGELGNTALDHSGVEAETEAQVKAEGKAGPELELEPKKPGLPTPPVVQTKPPARPTLPSEKTPIPSRPTSLFEFFTRPYAQSFGAYDGGNLKTPDLLPNEGGGFLKVFRSRERGYASLDLTTLIVSAAQAIRQELPATERLQIGDLSDRDGGPGSGHASHQNGLDGDVVFLRKNHAEMNPEVSKPNVTGFEEDFVDSKGRVTSNFDIEANFRLLRILTSTGRVDRVFVDQNIKRVLCAYADEKGMRAEWGETLRKLRHWPNHQDHFHLRLTCPRNSTACKPGTPLPTGDGCPNTRGGGTHKSVEAFSVEAAPDSGNETTEQGC